MSLKKIAFLFFIVSYVSAYAETNDYDIRSLGDVWIITVDDSGSMTSRYGGKYESPHAMATRIYNDLITNDEMFSIVDWEKDRFIFFTSGFSYNYDKGYGNELQKAAPFESSFIHYFDKTPKLYKFNDKRELSEHIKNIIATNKYRHQSSFVSIIRTFSIIKAVNFLKANNLEDSFVNMKVMTITDDADQTDQWRNDYRELKACAPNRFEEVKDSTTKYIYNSLNGSGYGILKELYKNEETIPHVWIYDYITRNSLEPLYKELDLFSVEASDGQNITIKWKKNNTFFDNTYDICFFLLDSLKINGSKICADKKFTKSFYTSGTYDNKLKMNNVNLQGRIQIKYYDPIYGYHYKFIPFSQNVVVPSSKISTTWWSLCVFFGLISIWLILYYTYLKPNSIIFKIYSNDGKTYSVKHGFRKDWKRDNNPLQAFATDDFGRIDSIIRHNKRIKVKTFNISQKDKPEVLICSRFPINLSIKEFVFLSTDEDIDYHYIGRSCEYSDLLKYAYNLTFIRRLYNKYREHYNLYGCCMKWLIKCYNIFNKRYYYGFTISKHCPSITFSSESFFGGKEFNFEQWTNTNQSMNKDSKYICCALENYYRSLDSLGNFILCRNIHDGTIVWYALQLNMSNQAGSSLRNVRCILKWGQTNSNQQEYGTELIKTYLEKKYKSKVVVIDINNFDEEYSPLFCFNVLMPSASGFISYVESSNASPAQQLYSPVDDGDMQYKQVKINAKYGDGLLYISAIPFCKELKSTDFCRMLSKTVVRNNIRTSEQLYLFEDAFKFREINEKI